MTRPVYATQAEETRWGVALAAAERVAGSVAYYAHVPPSVCRAMATAILAELGTSGYLAPLAGDRDE